MSLKLAGLAGATLALCALIDPAPVAAQTVNCADMYSRVMALYQAAPLSPAYNQMAAAYAESCLTGAYAAPIYMQTYVQAPAYPTYDYPYYGGYGYGFPVGIGVGFGFGRGFHDRDFHHGGGFHGGSFHGEHHR